MVLLGSAKGSDRMRNISNGVLAQIKRKSFAAAALVSMLALAGCGGTEGIPGLSGGTAAPDASSGGTPVSGQTIGSGPVKVGLLLPLSSGNGAAPAQALRNAAELALTEFNGQELTILVKDDQGTSAGAASATQQAISEGAELILGPLFAPAVAGAGPVARAANRPVIAFSSDAGVASPGVYLLSFLPQADVNRIIGFAGSRGKKRFAILAPQDAYGDATVAQAQNAVATIDGATIVGVQRYPAGQIAGAIQGFSSTIAGADALFIPEDGAAVAAAAPALAAVGAGSKVQLLGTGRWNVPAVTSAAGLNGAWFSGPDGAGFANFARRYQAKYGAAPTRIATLSYDAVALAAILTRTQGEKRFTPGLLQSASGFGGQDGVFRFKSDGTNDRALAIFQIGGGNARIISPAAKSFARGGT
jgi:hypothetical protein